MPLPNLNPFTPKSDSGVAELQRVLKTYVQITGYQPADPGAVDGIIGVKTTMAVIAMLPRVPGLPAEVRALAPVLTLMLATAEGKQQAFDLIRKNAGSISKAVIALEAYRIGTATGTPGTTPSTTAIKTGALNYAASLVWMGAAPTPGGAVPAMPAASIWFYDSWKRTYRVAVPQGTLAGFADYVEVAPAASRPNFGTEVGRGAFMSAVGQWWATPLGMAALGVLTLGGGYAAYRGARALL